MASDAPAISNPLLQDWNTPFGIPPFDAIEPEHYRPAFDQAIGEHEAEIATIAESESEPDFENTIIALERSGKALRNVLYVFFNLTGTDTNETLQEIEREVSPVLARHHSAMFLNEQLFRRVDKIFSAKDSLDLDPEQARVLERYHTAFVRSGARLDQAAKTRMTEITERLATLGTSFAQNVLADEAGFTLVLENEDDLAGLPELGVIPIWRRFCAANSILPIMLRARLARLFGCRWRILVASIGRHGSDAVPWWSTPRRSVQT